MVDSAESLHVTAGELYDFVEERIRTAVGANRLIYSVKDESLMVDDPSRSGSDRRRSLYRIPKEFERPLPDKYKLTEDQKQEVLKEAVAMVNRRRKLVEQHHDQWHQLSREAFPMREFLKQYPDER